MRLFVFRSSDIEILNYRVSDHVHPGGQVRLLPPST
jgi:hypothetical protein